jgi:hypothetical protein
MQPGQEISIRLMSFEVVIFTEDAYQVFSGQLPHIGSGYFLELDTYISFGCPPVRVIGGSLHTSATI